MSLLERLRANSTSAEEKATLRYHTHKTRQGPIKGQQSSEGRGQSASKSLTLSGCFVFMSLMSVKWTIKCCSFLRGQRSRKMKGRRGFWKTESRDCLQAVPCIGGLAIYVSPCSFDCPSVRTSSYPMWPPLWHQGPSSMLAPTHFWMVTLRMEGLDVSSGLGGNCSSRIRRTESIFWSICWTCI